MKYKFVLGLVMMLFFPANAMASTLSLSPATGTFNTGCTFTLNVVLDTQGVQTDGTDAILVYDPTRFSINTSSITPNTSVYPDFPGNNVDATAGKITISGLASVSTPFSGTGTLASLQFSVNNTAPAGPTQINFDFDPNNKAKTTDSNVVERTTIADTLNSVINGSYVIGTGSCNSQTPTSPTTTTATTTTTIVVPNQGFVTAPNRGGQGVVYTSTPPAQPKTLDQFVDNTGKGPGTPELTFTLAIFGSVLTVLGILGLALL